MQFIVDNLPIALCLIAGLVLVVIEMFIPGFGFLGLSGILLLGGAVIFTWINYGAMVGSLMLIGVLILTVICLIISLRSASKGKLSRSNIFMKQDKVDGETLTPEQAVAVGDAGVVESMLRPAGIVAFGDRRVSVVSEGKFINKGTRVRVKYVEGTRIVVEEDQA